MATVRFRGLNSMQWSRVVNSHRRDSAWRPEVNSYCYSLFKPCIHILQKKCSFCSVFLGGAAASSSGAPPPPTGANVVQARNAKKNALEEFAKENNLKPESIKKAYKRSVAFLIIGILFSFGGK